VKFVIVIDNRKEKDTRPLFTIITCVLNAVDTIEDTISSVLNQTFDDFEYVVIDGGSTDGTLDVIRRYSEKIDYCISEPDQGLYFGFNKGVKLARGRYIGILNGDDSYKPNALALVNEMIIKHVKNDYIIYGGVSIIGEFSRDEFFHHLNIPTAMISHPATFVASSIYHKVGMFNTEFKVAADYEFIARCFMNGYEFISIENSLANYRPGGYSNRNWILSIKESIKIRKSLNNWKPLNSYFILVRILLATGIHKAKKFILKQRN
jgi:glycosyltransferase involved in cell wall biosynthesis